MKSYSEMKVYPVSWETSKRSVSKQWVVRYEYTDKSGVIHPKAFRGMNHIKDHGERVLYTKFLLKQEQKLLDEGYNPVTEEFEGVAETLILTPRTPFMRALEIAMNSKKMTEDSRKDELNTLKHVNKYATLLRINAKDIQDITKGDIKQLLLSMMNDNHSNYRVNKTRTHISSYFTIFTELDFFGENFVKGITKLEHTPTVKEIIREKTDWERFESLRNIHYYLHRFATIFFYSGSRIVEVLGVKKEDVDLEKGIFWIIVKKGGKHIRTMRAINMHSFELWKEAVYESGADQYIFSHNMLPGDVRENKQSAYKLWKKYSRYVGLNVTLYSLKYAFLNQVSKMFGLQKAQELAGHTNNRTTKIYAIDHNEHQVERNKNIDIKIG